MPLGPARWEYNAQGIRMTPLSHTNFDVHKCSSRAPITMLPHGIS